MISLAETIEDAKRLAQEIHQNTGEPVQVIALETGRFLLIVGKAKTPTHQDEIAKLIKEAMIPITRPDPALKFNLSQLAKLTQDSTILRSPGQCLICGQRRCQAHGSRYHRK